MPKRGDTDRERQPGDCPIDLEEDELQATGGGAIVGAQAIGAAMNDEITAGATRVRTAGTHEITGALVKIN